MERPCGCNNSPLGSINLDLFLSYKLSRFLISTFVRRNVNKSCFAINYILKGDDAPYVSGGVLQLMKSMKESSDGFVIVKSWASRDE